MHIPVLQKEVIKFLDPKPNESFIDCTIGEGGHGLAILEKVAPRGKVLGIDCQLRLKPRERLILAEDNFANLKEIVHKKKFGKADGIIFDLGMSSWHLEESGRGFSFKRTEPLDMRYAPQNKLTAEKIVNYYSKFEIEETLREYGEEKKSRQIAEKIIEARRAKPIKNTLQLSGIIREAGVSPQRAFQALRIAVNDELNNLERILPQAMDILNPGGRMAVISFHSLEDRIVKNFFKSFQTLTRKPVIPTREEIKNNYRSRSAKLRAIIK